jgi:replicative DNA helicase
MNLDEDFLEKNILLQSIRNQYYFGNVIDYIDLKYFSNTSVLAVYRKILNFYKQYKKQPTLVEIKTLLSSSEEKSHFENILKSFKGLDTNVDIEVLLDQTQQFLKEKAIISTMHEVVDEFKTLEHSEIARRFQEACSLSIITDIGFDYFKNIEDHIDWLKIDHPKISTGFKFYDDKLKGGFNKNGRALYVWLGATNSGKSLVLGNLAANIIKQNYCVPIISLEMDEQLYAQRLSCNLSKIGFDDLKKEEDEFRKRINDIKNNNPNADLIIKEFPPGKLSVNDLDSYLAKLKKYGKNFDIVFLDYITLMRATNASGLYEAGKRLAEDVRALSYKYGVSFVTVIQANRSGVTNNQPKLDNTSESMGIAHTADFMASIWREEEDHETSTIRTGIIKNRIGENFGTRMLELDTYLRIKEVDSIYEEDGVKMNDYIKEQIKSFSGMEDIFGDD